MQGAQNLAWADNAIKLAVDMTVAAIDRVNVQGNAEAAGAADPRGDGDRLPRGGHPGARGAPGPLLDRSLASSSSREARPRAMTSLKERKQEDEDIIAAKPHPERDQADRDLRADGVGQHTGRRSPASEHLHQQRLLGAGAAGREGQQRGRPHHQHQQRVLDRRVDVEGLEQEVGRAQPAAPADGLDTSDLPQVASASAGSSRPGPRGPRRRARGGPASAGRWRRERPITAIRSPRWWRAKKAHSKAGADGSSGRLGSPPECTPRAAPTPRPCRRPLGQQRGHDRRRGASMDWRQA